MAKKTPTLMDTIVSLCKRRGFIFQASEIYGGIGNTWDCIVHVYLRRALLTSQCFGDDARQLREIERDRLGAAHGLP